METVLKQYFGKAIEEESSQRELFWLCREFERLPREWREAIVRGKAKLQRKEMEKVNMETTFYTQWGKFVIRKGSPVPNLDSALRHSSNAFLTKLQGNPNVAAYELRMTVRTKATNYEKGVE